MTRIYRYPKTNSFTSPLNHMDDLVNLVKGFRSLEYTASVLQETHLMTSSNQINSAAQSIRVHVDNALALLEQGLSASTEISYLPIYYAMQNLAKVVIISHGLKNELDEQRYHGITWDRRTKNARSLLTDEVTIRKGGVFGLYYQALTDTFWSQTRKAKKSTYDRKLKMRDIYSLITPIGYEYTLLTKEQLALDHAVVDFSDNPQEGKYTLRVQMFPIDGIRPLGMQSEYRLLRGFTPESNNRYSLTRNTHNELMNDFPRYLLYDQKVHVSGFAEAITFTPRSNSTLLMPSELPILLAFFHLSNVVRYDPERLYRLFDTRAVPLLRALARHGLYGFLRYFLSFMTQTTLDLRSP